MMKSNQTIYIFLAFIGILMWNGMIIQRDKKMFDAYDRMCAEQPLHSNCRLKL